MSRLRKRFKKAVKRVGGKVQEKARKHWRKAADVAMLPYTLGLKAYTAGKGLLSGQKPKEALQSGLSAGGFGGYFGGSQKSDEDLQYRSEAARKIRTAKKQAGAGQIKYQEEVWE